MGSPAPFPFQVAGHPSSILSSPISSSTLIKPSSATERAFYSQIGPTLHPHFIGKWTPKFYGTLTLEGKMTGEGVIDKGAVDSGEPDEMLVLESLTYPFRRPNVLDIKLGTQLYDESATEEKKARMRKAAEVTTSATTGIRLTGFQVWDAKGEAYVSTPKAFGKALKPDQLQHGLSYFFPTATATAPPSTSSASSASTSSLTDSTTPFSPASSPIPAPLPLSLLKAVLLKLLERLAALTALFATLEVRIRGGSLLIVVEGSPEHLASALERPDPVSDNEEEDDEDGDEDEEEDGDEQGSTTSSSSPLPHALRAVDLRLIDFAHATWCKGYGPDEGVLLGLRTTRALLQGVLERVDKELEVASRST